MSVASILDPTTGVILSEYLPASSASVQSITAGNGIAITGTSINPIVSTALSAGVGITLSGTTVRQIANNGVLSVSAGTGITVGGTATAPVVNNVGVLSLTAGTGITLTGTATAPIVNAFEPTITQQFLTTGQTVGGGGDETTLFAIPSFITGKHYRATVQYSLQYTDGSTPGATDCVLFSTTGLASPSGTTTNVLSTNTTYLTDIKNAGAGNADDRCFHGSFSIVFLADGSFTPSIFIGSSATTGSSGTDLPIRVVGLDNTTNVSISRCVWEQMD
jgi:hypothetical protein